MFHKIFLTACFFPLACFADPIADQEHYDYDKLVQAQQAAPKHAAAKPDHPTETFSSHAPSPWATLGNLMAGNKRFIEGHSKHPSQSLNRRTELASGQTPRAIILSCSDSRVPPELIFDQGLGDLFVVRTAGEVVEPSAIASIEYAVEHLHANLILVMGHTSCGAVKATLSTPVGKSAGSENLDVLVGLIRPHVSKFTLDPKDKKLLEPVKANVDGVAKTLLLKSKILREMLEQEEIMISQGVYHLDSGRVEVWF